MQQEEPNKYVKELTQEKYKYGFTTDVHTDVIEKGLNEDVIRLISEKKGEPDWMLEFRLKAYRHWLTLEMPTWAHLRIPEIDYQSISYYADPTKKKEGPKSMDEVDPELIKTFNKLGIQGNTDGERHYLLFDERGHTRTSRPGAEVPGLCGALP